MRLASLACMCVLASAAQAGTPENLALRKPARQSSTAAGGNPNKAVDGNTNGEKAALAMTGNAGGSWFEVDLGAPTAVGEVRVFNRTDCCTDRIKNARVELSSTPCDAPSVVASAIVPGKEREQSLSFPTGPTARYVCVRQSRVVSLALAEVQVFAAPPREPTLETPDVSPTPSDPPPSVPGPGTIQTVERSAPWSSGRCDPTIRRPPDCEFRLYNTSHNFAASSQGFALPAVSRSRPSNRSPGSAAKVNDGAYGPGSSWFAQTPNDWVKIDLGRVITVDHVRLGRNRFNDLPGVNPGRITVSTALEDGVYRDTDETNDAAEYTLRFDSNPSGFTGSFQDKETLEFGFAAVQARYLKVQVENDGAALDEIEVSPAQGRTLSTFPTESAGAAEVRAGFSAPQGTFQKFSLRDNLAAVGAGTARPAVAKDALASYPAIHATPFLNDGAYGNGSSWISASSNAWVKIDLGRIVPVDSVRFGRDRASGVDDRDPGRFLVSVAWSDATYENGQAGADEAEYTIVYDSAKALHPGEINGQETIHIQFPELPARFVKIQFEREGTAIDEVEVWASGARDVLSPGLSGPYRLRSSLDEYLDRGTASPVHTVLPQQSAQWFITHRNADTYIQSWRGEYLASSASGALSVSNTPVPWTLDVLATRPNRGALVRLKSRDRGFLVGSKRPAVPTVDPLPNGPDLAEPTLWVLEPVSRPDNPDPSWSCLPGVDAAVRFVNGDVQCLSNGRNCLALCAGTTERHAYTPSPHLAHAVLSCGALEKSRTGFEGYEVRNTQCASACAQMPSCTKMGVGELARGRPAEQSSCSQYSTPTDPQGAVDGLMTGRFGFHTNTQLDPWWQVDLGESAALARLEVVNRSDCCSDRASPLHVQLSDDGVSFVTVSLANPLAASGINTIDLGGRIGRFVRVWVSKETALHLDEVRVFGRRTSLILPASYRTGDVVEEPVASGEGVPARKQVGPDRIFTTDTGRTCLTANFDPNGDWGSSIDLGPCNGSPTQVWRSLGTQLQGAKPAESICFSLDQWQPGQGTRAKHQSCDDRYPSQNVTWDDGKLVLHDGRCLVRDGVRLRPGACSNAVRFESRPVTRRSFLTSPGNWWNAVGELCDSAGCRLQMQRVTAATRPLLGFNLIAGLEGVGTVSFESATEPGRYLVRSDNTLILTRVTDRLSQSNASFRMVETLGDRRLDTYSFESVGRPGTWLRRSSAGGISIEAPSSGAFMQDASFELIPWRDETYTPTAPIWSFALRSSVDAKCLVPNGTAVEGAPLKLVDCDSDATRFLFSVNDQGDLRDVASGLCVSRRPPGQCALPTPILSACRNKPEQKWVVDANTQSDDLLTVSQGRMCLSIKDGEPVIAACTETFNVWSTGDRRSGLRRNAWYCLPNVESPVRRVNDTLQCMSDDGVTCAQKCGQFHLPSRDMPAQVSITGTVRTAECVQGCDYACKMARQAFAMPNLQDVALAKRFAPVLVFSNHQRGYPMSAQRYFEALRANDPRLAQEDSPGVKNDSLESTAPTYYQVNSCGGQVRIHYWWFYGVQEMCLPVRIPGERSGRHHGDWEHILVTLSQDRSKVASVTFYQHNAWYTRVAGPRAAPCTDVDRCRDRGFETEDGRPVIYVGDTAHGSYHSPAPGSGIPCSYWSDRRGGGSRWYTSSTLVDLEVNSERWMTVDRFATKENNLRWGPENNGSWSSDEGGISTHPTQEPPSMAVRTCRGTPTYDDMVLMGKGNGCYMSECLAGDDQTAFGCIKECEPGFENMGLTCHRWWKPKSYGRMSETYGYEYELPTTDTGLTRRRRDGEW